MTTELGKYLGLHEKYNFSNKNLDTLKKDHYFLKKETDEKIDLFSTKCTDLGSNVASLESQLEKKTQFLCKLQEEKERIESAAILEIADKVHIHLTLALLNH